MTLRELFSEIPTAEILGCANFPQKHQVVSGVFHDARKPVKDGLFVCIRGTDFDGHKAIPAAIAGGAAVILIEDDGYIKDCSVPWILVRDTHALLLPLYLAAYGHPERRMRMIAVTGTNGKTSVTYLLEAIFRKRGLCAVFGTVENRIGDMVFPAANTTPAPDTLASLLRRAADSGVKTVIMEASSHALAQKRLSGLCFDCGIFLNLTEDHLDYHKTMERYYACKRSLFFQCRAGLCCSDDPYGHRLAADPAFPHRMYSFSAEGKPHADFSARDIAPDADGAVYCLSAPDREFCIRTPLAGAFAVQNTLAAASCAHLLGVPAECIVSGIRSLDRIPGRMECLVREPFSVYIDYAHTPDALEKVLASLRSARKKPDYRIRVLFGCGGDREREKRPLMGRIAASYADEIMISADNSRTESLYSIIADICRGIPADQKSRVSIISDRRQAIGHLMRTAAPHDLILLAGKGHETYQIDESGRHPFSERDIVLSYMT